MEELEDSDLKKQMIMSTMTSRSAQNVGKDQISRTKHFPAPFGAFSVEFVHAPGTKSQLHVLAILLGGPMAAIQPVLSNGCNLSAAIRLSLPPDAPGRTLSSRRANSEV